MINSRLAKLIFCGIFLVLIIKISLVSLVLAAFLVVIFWVASRFIFSLKIYNTITRIMLLVSIIGLPGIATFASGFTFIVAIIPFIFFLIISIQVLSNYVKLETRSENQYKIIRIVVIASLLYSIFLPACGDDCAPYSQIGHLLFSGTFVESLLNEKYSITIASLSYIVAIFWEFIFLKTVNGKFTVVTRE